MRHARMLALIILTWNGGVFARSQTAVPQSAPEPLRLSRVALFKNGFGFFVGQAPLPTDEEGARFLLPAVPVQGTFWLSYPTDVNLVSVVAEKTTVKGERLEAITIPEILKANVGKRVRVVIDEKQVSGRITHFTEDRRRPVILPYTPGVPESGESRPEIWPPYETGLVLIDIGGATLSLNPQSIQHVTFLDRDIQRHFARTRDGVAVDIRAATPGQRQNLTVSFLAKGITWTPSYLVDVSQDEKAMLSAKALIVNEVYDLNDVSVQLATGFPRLQYSDVLSPIGMKEPLAQFLARLAGSEPGELKESQVMRRAYAMEAAAPGFGGAAMDVAPGYGAAAEGITAEDLFLYPVGRITLRQDRVAYVPLFTEAIPYEDLYKWDIPDYTDEAGQFLFRRGEPDEKDRQEVWHSIRLENTTKVPWTPAPAEAIQNDMLLGQASMEYTPSGGEATLRISRAADIKAEQREIEVERKRGATQMYEMYFDLVTVRGELAVTNYKEKAVTLEIVKTLSGEVVSTDPQAEIEKLVGGIQRVNGLSRLTWEIEIAAGDTQKVAYTYQVYIRGQQRPNPAIRSFSPPAPEPEVGTP